MGQDWHILNIDAKEKSFEGSVKLSEFFFDDLCGLYKVLCPPVLPYKVDVWLKGGKKVMQPGPFGKLSVELIDSIYEELSEETLHVIVSLAVTCKHLLAIGKRHILRSMRNSHASWIGGRLVCLGEYTQNNELPKGMLSDAERKEAQEAIVPDVPREEMSFVTFASRTYDRDKTVRKIRYKQNIAACHAYALSIKKPRRELTPPDSIEDKMLNYLCCEDYQTYPNQEPMVLCNITKGEYVRDDKMSKMVMRHGKYTVVFGLAHALLSRICWSSEGSVALWCDEVHLEKLTKGPWVGDRFCITTLDTRPSAGAGKEWKDVTAEVDELLMHLWKMNKRDYYA